MEQRPFSVRTASWREDERSLRSVRLTVFVIEQNIDAGEEFDEVDLVCDHILARDNRGTPIGTARIDSHGKIGRMAVLAAWRNSGVGRALLQSALDLARRKGFRRVYLHAQVTALGFYEREGFTAYGDRFLEARIEHVAMERQL